MFNLFSGKVSSVFSLAFQGISKALGFITKSVITVVDEIVEVVSTISAPIVDKLVGLPVIGNTIASVTDTANNLLDNLSQTVHGTADHLLNGQLETGVTHLLGQVTPTLGGVVQDASHVVDNLLDVIAPVTQQLSQVPVLGNLIQAADQSLNNLTGLVDETGAYVAGVNPVDLLSSTLQNPIASVGGIVQDVSSTLDALLDDIAPLTTTLGEIPVAGGAVTLVGETVNTVNTGIFDLGSHLAAVNPLPLELNAPLPFV